MPRALLHAVRQACELAYPEEGCGLLIGRRGTGHDVAVVGLAASRNVAGAGRRHERFAVDPEMQFRTLRRLRGTSLAVVGHFHSHPDGAAIPSATDLACAFEPGFVWLITAVACGRATVTRAFRPHPARGCFKPLVLRLMA